MDPNQCHWMKERLVGFSGKVEVSGGYREVKQDGARAPLEGIEPICAQAVRELKDLAPEADIFVKIIAKNIPLVCKADHFDMMMLDLETFPGVKMITIKPHTEKEHPSVLTNEPISLLEMGKVGKKLQVLPKNQDDKVAALHHEKVEANLTPFKPARSGDKKKKDTKRETNQNWRSSSCDHGTAAQASPATATTAAGSSGDGRRRDGSGNSVGQPAISCTTTRQRHAAVVLLLRFRRATTPATTTTT
ncbi:hypothetical protein MRB53_035403 [Persea americana]|uniref:Uncharacterized protein n=1 Tax=Persea americana TaxID=3435 RepID=A0ACC2K4I4_PERAE|nr:hypothetical protein MRB53_035403 [Persea americana]